MGKKIVFICVELDHDEHRLASTRVADSLRAHADFLDECVMRGEGPDENGEQPIDETAKVVWHSG